MSGNSNAEGLLLDLLTVIKWSVLVNIMRDTPNSAADGWMRTSFRAVHDRQAS